MKVGGGGGRGVEAENLPNGTISHLRGGEMGEEREDGTMRRSREKQRRLENCASRIWWRGVFIDRLLLAVLQQMDNPCQLAYTVSSFWSHWRYSSNFQNLISAYTLVFLIYLWMGQCHKSSPLHFPAPGPREEDRWITSPRVVPIFNDDILSLKRPKNCNSRRKERAILVKRAKE